MAWPISRIAGPSPSAALATSAVSVVRTFGPAFYDLA
jgi:hypothetical protein